MAKRRSGRSSDSEDQDDLEDEELEDDEDDPGDEDDESSDDDQSSRRQSSSQSKQGEKSKSGEKTRTLTQTQLDIIIQREKRKAVRQVERRLRDGTESDENDDSDDDDSGRKGGSKRSPHTAELVTLRSERTRLEDENDELTGVVEEQIELLMQELPADVIDLLDLTDEKEPASKRLRRLLKAKDRHETQKAAARRRKKDNPDDGDEERAPAGSRQDPPRRRSRGRKGRLDQMREELFRRSGGYSAID